MLQPLMQTFEMIQRHLKRFHQLNFLEEVSASTKFMQRTSWDLEKFEMCVRFTGSQRNASEKGLQLNFEQISDVFSDLFDVIKVFHIHFDESDCINRQQASTCDEIFTESVLVLRKADGVKP